MTRTFRIAVFGSRGSGKTIFLACLLDALTNGGRVRLGKQTGMFEIAAHENTVEWLKDIKEILRRGDLPLGTDRTTELAVDFSGSGKTRVTFKFRDYRGGDFENARWRDRRETDKEGVSIAEMLKDCDAVVLLLDAPRLARQPDAIDFERYVAALSEYKRLNPRGAVPVQILYSKRDEAQGVDFKALARAWPPFRQLVSAWREHNELYDEAVSCLRVDRSGERARPVPDGSRLFRPSGVVESFLWIAERILARARRVQMFVFAAALIVFLSALAVPWGWLATAHGREASALMRELAEPLDEREALTRIGTHEQRWSGVRQWLLTPWPPFRSSVQTVRAERERRGAGIRRQLRGAIDQALAAEPRDGLAQGIPFYRRVLEQADEHIRLFGATDGVVVAARGLFHEKVRVLVLKEQLSTLDAAQAVVAIDKALGEKRFSVFMAHVADLRREAQEDAAWNEAYGRVIAGLPNLSGNIDTPRLHSAIAAIDDWYRAHGSARPRAAQTTSTLSLKRAYQLAVLTNAADAARVQANGKDKTAQLQIWRRFLEQHDAHGLPAGSEEARRWATQLQAIRDHVNELEAQLAQERRLAAEQALAHRASEQVRVALQLARPLTDDKRLRLKAALDRIGPEAAALAYRTQVQRHWERLAYESILDEYRAFLADPTRRTLAALRLAWQAYEGDKAFNGGLDSRHAFISSLSHLLTWAESPRELKIHVQQSGPMYVELEAGRVRVDTARDGSAFTVTLGAVDVLAPIRISYRYRDRGEPTRVATVYWKPIETLAVANRSYRGSTVFLRFDTGRPAVTEPPR